MQFVLAHTCQPAITVSVAATQWLFSTLLLDCLSPPLTLTWTLCVKDRISSMAGGMWLFQYLDTEEMHVTPTKYNKHTQQNHRMSNKHNGTYICKSYSSFLSLYSPIIHLHTYRYVHHHLFDCARDI